MLTLTSSLVNPVKNRPSRTPLRIRHIYVSQRLGEIGRSQIERPEPSASRLPVVILTQTAILAAVSRIFVSFTA